MAIVKEVEKKITSHQYAYDTIAYVLSPENKHGDEKCFRATCLNCINDGVESLSKQFYVTRKAFNKDDKILSHHYVQSFSPNENVTPELAHQIAVELMKKVAPNYQVIISTHVDKDHIHNHIIINSVSMETGMKWKANWRTRMDMRKESDKLCKQYGLSAIDNKSGLRVIDQATQKLAEKGQSWKVDLCRSHDTPTGTSPFGKSVKQKKSEPILSLNSSERFIKKKTLRRRWDFINRLHLLNKLPERKKCSPLSSRSLNGLKKITFQKILHLQKQRR